MPAKNFNKELIRRYRDNKATEEELEVFFQLMNEGKLENELKEILEEESIVDKEKGLLVPMPQRRWFRIASAAVLIFIATGTYLLVNKTNNKQPITSNEKPAAQDIAPGGNKAVLTLADNTQIILDNAANGTLTQQGNSKVIKLENGMLAYNALNENPLEIIYNTITTPRGGQYQLTLSDGSKVWLNAASTLRFPASFVGDERKVELTGEGYFEVAKDALRPFIVNIAGKGEVEVLGTHFNINSYSDEDNITTTLIEGSVKVTTGASATTIRPGQQAIVSSNGQLSTATAVNIDEIVGWKDGWFHFESADLKTILRQFARWYDVEVIYEEPVNNRKFFAVVKRSSTLKNVLEMLQDNNIVYRIEGKKLIVKSG